MVIAHQPVERHARGIGKVFPVGRSEQRFRPQERDAASRHKALQRPDHLAPIEADRALNAFHQCLPGVDELAALLDDLVAEFGSKQGDFRTDTGYEIRADPDLRTQRTFSREVLRGSARRIDRIGEGRRAERRMDMAEQHAAPVS